MKKSVVLSVSAVLLLSSCNTYTGSGAYAGASLGSVLGSAIGGISGGPRGSDIGTLVGLAGGAVVGAAVGSQADKASQAEYEQYQQERKARRYDNTTSNKSTDDTYAYSGSTSGNYSQQAQDDSGFDPTGSGDDVLYDFNNSDYTGNYSAADAEHVTTSVSYDKISNVQDVSRPDLEIRNARFVDDNEDRKLNAGELCKVIFEVYNNTSSPIYDVQPTVIETSGNKYIYISNSIHVEKIAPGKGVRYTAMVKAGSRLKNGVSCFRVYAVQGNGNMSSNVCEFNVVTSKK
ncbi:MAG: hypothetical protein Q4D41_01265 [Prevotellaceae bacterium]|nr:hypothetical protein [Prevotellaceae bacterium]